MVNWIWDDVGGWVIWLHVPEWVVATTQKEMQMPHENYQWCLFAATRYKVLK